MASLIKIEAPRFAYGDAGKHPTLLPFKADTGQTWSYGDILKFNTGTGKALVAAAGDAVLLGIAQSSCPFTTRADVTDYPVLVFTRGCVLAMNIWYNDDQDVNSIIAQANIGNKYDLAISGTPNDIRYVVNIGATTDQIFKIEAGTGNPDGGVLGDIYQRVLVRLVDSAIGWEA